jgi:hypothetical protein
MHLVRLAAIAACVAAASSSVAAPFQPQATSGPIDAYEDSARGKNGVLEGEGTVVFAPIKSSRVLIVHVACGFGLKPGDSVAIAGLNIQGQTLSNPFPATKMAAIPDGTFNVINAQIYLFVDKGKVPEIDVVSTGKRPISLTCILSGYHA